jgi:hypothetical protein
MLIFLASFVCMIYAFLVLKTHSHDLSYFFRTTLGTPIPGLDACIMVRVMVVLRHFQQYFSYIVAVNLLVEETGENYRPVASH